MRLVENRGTLFPKSRLVSVPSVLRLLFLGLRNCPGQNQALMQVKLALVLFLNTFRYEIREELLHKEDTSYSQQGTTKLMLRMHKL